MTLGFSISWASEEEHVLSGGGKLSELVESEGLTSSLNNSSASSGSELEGDDSKSLGDVKESDIVGDGSNNGDDSGVELGLSFGDDSAIFGEVLGDSGDGDGISVQPGLVESLVNDLVELGFGPSGEEGVELHDRGGTLMRLFR